VTDKRVTLTKDDVELIVAALRALHDKSISSPLNYPENALASKQRINAIGAKIGFDGKVRV